jgi:hypothetical protein
MFQPYQLYMTFYFADSRPLAEIRTIIEKALGCTLRVYETEEYRDEERYRGYVFGFSIFLEYAGTWRDGFVYRLAGAARTADAYPDAPKIALDHHVMELLRRYEVTTFYTIEQYRVEAEFIRMRNSPAEGEEDLQS